MAQKATLMFDGEPVTCVFGKDANGEFVFTAEDGRFVKFPADCDLEKAVDAYNEANAVVREKAVKKQYGAKIKRNL